MSADTEIVRCPVCRGRGTAPAAFCSPGLGTVGTAADVCQACDGRGLRQPEAREIAQEASRLTARWIATLAMPLISEHWVDPEERWRQLRAALRRFDDTQRG